MAGVSVAALALASSFPVTAGAAAGSSSKPGPTGSFHAAAPVADMVAKKKGCKYSHLVKDAQDGTSSQNFETPFDAYDDQAADDFACRKSIKKIRKVTVVGQTSLGIDPRDFNVLVWADNGAGEPDDSVAPVCNLANRPYATQPTNKYVIAGGPCSLTAGTKYWLTVQANQDFNPDGQWFWEGSTAESFQSPADWRNHGPGSGFGVCPTFSAGVGVGQDMATCLGVPYKHLMFAIR
jgi:hypothetical protein